MKYTPAWHHNGVSIPVRIILIRMFLTKISILFLTRRSIRIYELKLHIFSNTALHYSKNAFVTSVSILSKQYIRVGLLQFNFEFYFQTCYLTMYIWAMLHENILIYWNGVSIQVSNIGIRTPFLCQVDPLISYKFRLHWWLDIMALTLGLLTNALRKPWDKYRETHRDKTSVISTFSTDW